MPKKIQSNINAYIGLQIRTIRIGRGWEQQGLADKLAISNSSFSKIEHGYIDINIHRLKQIASVLQVELDQLLPDTLSDAIADIEEKINMCDNYITRLQQIVHDLEFDLHSNPVIAEK